MHDKRCCSVSGKTLCKGVGISWIFLKRIIQKVTTTQMLQRKILRLKQILYKSLMLLKSWISNCSRSLSDDKE